MELGLAFLRLPWGSRCEFPWTNSPIPPAVTLACNRCSANICGMDQQAPSSICIMCNVYSVLSKYL